MGSNVTTMDLDDRLAPLMNRPSDQPQPSSYPTDNGRKTCFALELFWLLLLVLMMLNGTGCGGNKEDLEATGAPSKDVSMSILRVTVMPSSIQSMPRFLHVTGQLQGNLEARVAANTSGKISALHVERGSKVDQGDPLAEVDVTNAALTLREAEAMVAVTEAQLALAITELERFEPLAKSKAISDSEFQKLKAERVARQAALDSAVAQRNLARKAVDDSVIRAPFSGQVVERFVQTGEFVMPPAPVVHLVEVSKLRLVLNVPETAASLITTGQKVYFKTALFEDETFSGVIAYISGALRATARDLVVEALVDNDDQRLKPGYFAEADIQLPHQNVLCITTEALRKNGSNTSAFVLKNGEVEERLIDKGVAADGWVEIRKGVQEGESVIITSDLPPKDGMKASLAQP